MHLSLGDFQRKILAHHTFFYLQKSENIEEKIYINNNYFCRRIKTYVMHLYTIKYIIIEHHVYNIILKQENQVLI